MKKYSNLVLALVAGADRLENEEYFVESFGDGEEGFKKLSRATTK